MKASSVMLIAGSLCILAVFAFGISWLHIHPELLPAAKIVAACIVLVVLFGLLADGKRQT